MKTVILACLTLLLRVAAEAAPDKTGSAFFPAETRIRMRENAGKTAWGETVRQAVVESAQPWRAMSDEDLWELDVRTDHHPVVDGAGRTVIAPRAANRCRCTPGR